MSAIVILPGSEAIDISMYHSYKAIPPAKKAWITIKAKQRGKDPKKVHAGVKAFYTKAAIARRDRRLEERVANSCCGHS